MSQLECHYFGMESYRMNITMSTILSSFDLQSLQPYWDILFSTQTSHGFICYVIHQYHSHNLIHISAMKEKLSCCSRQKRVPSSTMFSVFFIKFWIFHSKEKHQL